LPEFLLAPLFKDSSQPPWPERKPEQQSWLKKDWKRLEVSGIMVLMVWLKANTDWRYQTDNGAWSRLRKILTALPES
jgi:hypothetical protein